MMMRNLLNNPMLRTSVISLMILVPLVAPHGH